MIPCGTLGAIPRLFAKTVTNTGLHWPVPV